MSQRTQLVERLKQALKARGLTYARVATAIGLSEASVKRMLSKQDLSLARLEAICALAQVTLAELARGIDAEERLLTELTDAQEATIVENPVLFLAATSALNLVDFDQILDDYAVKPAELVAAFAALDRIGILRWLPNNRYRLLVARTFRWRPNGPIQRSFREHAAEYFNSAFDGPDEFMVLLNARLSKAHAALVIERLQRLAKDVSEQHLDDARLPTSQRRPQSLLLAMRPWRPAVLRPIVRDRPATTRVVRRR